MLKHIVEQDQFELTPIGPKRLRNPSIDTKLFLQAWARKDPRVAMYVDEGVRRELKITLPPNERQQYVRSFKFRTPGAVQQFFGVPFEQLQKGESVSFQTAVITTWTKLARYSSTKTARQATRYSDPNYDNFNKKYYGVRDYQKMGIHDKQPVGYSVTIISFVPYDKVLVDLDYVPTSYLTRSTDKDVLVMPGDHKGIVVETSTAEADITGMINKQNKFSEQLAARDQIIQTEMEQAKKAATVVPQLLKKAGYKEKDLTEDSLIDFLYQHNDVAIAAGVILAYGDAFPKVVDWIENSKTHFVRSPWKFITLEDLIDSRKQIAQ
jgi:hypothetical protein